MYYRVPNMQTPHMYTQTARRMWNGYTVFLWFPMITALLNKQTKKHQKKTITTEGLFPMEAFQGLLDNCRILRSMSSKGGMRQAACMGWVIEPFRMYCRNEEDWDAYEDPLRITLLSEGKILFTSMIIIRIIKISLLNQHDYSQVLIEPSLGNASV